MAAGWFVLVGALVLTVGVLAGLGEMAGARQELSPDGIGQWGTLVAELLYLPNLIIFAAAYATGIGIAVGDGAAVSPFVTDQASLPNLPVLSLLPTTPPTWTALLPVVIIVGGWLAAVVAQRQVPVRGLRHRLMRAGVLSILVLATWLVAGFVAGGSLGSGRLDYVGPTLATALAGAMLIGGGAVVWALAPTLASDARPVAKDVAGRLDQGAQSLSRRAARRKSRSQSRK